MPEITVSNLRRYLDQFGMIYHALLLELPPGESLRITCANITTGSFQRLWQMTTRVAIISGVPIPNHPEKSWERIRTFHCMILDELHILISQRRSICQPSFDIVYVHGQGGSEMRKLAGVTTKTLTPGLQNIRAPYNEELFNALLVVKKQDAIKNPIELTGITRSGLPYFEPHPLLAIINGDDPNVPSVILI